MARSMNSIARLYNEMLDGLADWQADLLRRAATDMADALDREAQAAVEGAREWRDLQKTGNRYAD